MKKNEYKNAIRSKKKIASAYLKLLNKHEKFTITDIVDLAEINRGTFYLHFKNLTDVDRYIEEGLAENFKVLEEDFRQSDLSKTPEIILNKLNVVLLKDLEFYKLIVHSSETIHLMKKIENSIMKSISNNFKIMKYVNNYERFKIIVEYIVGGTITSYSEWIKGNIDCDIYTLSANIADLIKKGLVGVLSDN